MGTGAFIEPLVVLTLLLGGTYINRDPTFHIFPSAGERWYQKEIGAGKKEDSPRTLESAWHGAASKEGLLAQESRWRTREVGISGFRGRVITPNTNVFRGRIYQLGRAFTAVTLVQGTVHVARQHALQLIHLEQRLHIFHELPVQHFFLRHPSLLLWINHIYSFIHIPGTILFLIWLYYFTTTLNRVPESPRHRPLTDLTEAGSPAGPSLYEARRRTMAMCNLLAFVVFTTWPCMPPRLLNDHNYHGPDAAEARSYGFVDTVHGAHGASSVWTQNRFCNQYAAMPSLHFGYALLIGTTLLTIPLAPSLPSSSLFPSWRIFLLRSLGAVYPVLILLAIIATANHFILDAIAGAGVCAVAWWSQNVLRNLVVLEDWVLWCIGVAKPEGE
ncbi:MAG: hypothetical protein M1822_001893 [Bathelium mastoideum]|nr:MAG: hypothetical protein M1822_001893 [Bathelium mastoideum]